MKFPSEKSVKTLDFKQKTITKERQSTINPQAFKLEDRVKKLVASVQWKRLIDEEDFDMIKYLLFNNYDNYEYQEPAFLERYNQMDDTTLLSYINESINLRDIQLGLKTGKLLLIGGRVLSQDEIKKRVSILSEFLESKENQIEPVFSYHYFKIPVFKYKKSYYAIGENTEVNEALEDFFKENLWKTIPLKDLLDFCELPKTLEPILNDFIRKYKKESQQIILKFIEWKKGSEGLNAFITKIIHTYGRGKFLNPIDGQEYRQGNYFIYKIPSHQYF